MAGFANTISKSIDCVFATNADFSGSSDPNNTNGLQTNGQIWIGTTVPNVNGTNINVGTLSSPGGTVTIGYSSPNITIDVSGSGSVTSIKGTGNEILANGTSGVFVSGNVTLTIPLAFIAPGSIKSTTTVEVGNGNLTVDNGQVLVPVGSAAAPSYSFSALTNAGLYEAGNQVHMSVGGGETVRFSSDNTLFLFRANMTALQYAGNFQSTSAATFTPAAQNTLYIACDPTSNAITVNLPNVANDGQIFIIKDSTGQAATHNITVTTPGGTKTFDGATSTIINVAYGSLSVLYNPSTTNYEIF